MGSKRGAEVPPVVFFGLVGGVRGHATGLIVDAQLVRTEMRRQASTPTLRDGSGDLRGPPFHRPPMDFPEGDGGAGRRNNGRGETRSGSRERKRNEVFKRRKSVERVGEEGPIGLLVIERGWTRIRDDRSREGNSDGDRKMVGAQVGKGGPRTPRSDRCGSKRKIRRGERTSGAVKESRRERIVETGERRRKDPVGKRRAKGVGVRVEGVPERMMDVKITKDESRRGRRKQRRREGVSARFNR